MLMDQEASRLAALREYDVLDSPKEEEFDRITMMGARLFDVAVSCITLVDENRFFFKAASGSDVRNMDRQPGFCDTVIKKEGVYCIEDTTTDPVVKDHPLVREEPHIKSYAGSPLITNEGYAIGTLCVMDPSARIFTDAEKQLLQELSEFVMFHLDRRRIQRERVRQLEKERELQKLESLGMLAGGIAHDFNNLLVGMLGNASLAARELEHDNPIQEKLSGIIHAADVASELTDQLLAYSGQRPMSPKPVDIVTLINNMAPLLKSSVATGVSIKVESAESLPAVIGDPTQLRQVILNLVTNASDAYRGNPGQIVLTIHRSALGPRRESDSLQSGSGDQPFVRIDIRDSGCGMDADTLNSVFSPFFSTKESGRGLGMSIVQRIVRGHDGDLQVESEADRGSTVSIWLPAEAIPDVTVHSSDDVIEESVAGKGTVLVIDDEELVLNMTTAAIESFGYDVVGAMSGVQAIEMLDCGQQIDAIILDATMPGMDGRATLHEVFYRTNDVPTIVTSGHHIDEVASKFDNFESLTFLPKPWTIEQLSHALREANIG